MGLILLMMLLIQFNCAAASTQKEVRTNVGTFIGQKRDVEFKGVTKSYSEFRGIPYGEVPVGDLQFRKPVPKSPLAEPFNATYPRPSCPQLLFLKIPHFEYDEDCLRVDIYVPEHENTKDTEGVAVMIWIHGGAFQLGGSNLYIADTLSAFGDVIVVILNHRLSVFGFLSTGDEESPGNYGLWDQHLAIKWVHDNIESFGGDPEKVTVFGLSAGGASTLYQALYPGNKGLFQRVIPESGSPANHWAFNKFPDPTKFLVRAGCARKTSKEVLSCLRKKTTDQLFDDLNKGDPTWYEYGFTGVRDGEFVTTDPDELIASLSPTSKELEHFSSLDLLIGVTDMEGGYHMLTKWPLFLGIDDLESFPITRKTYEETVIPEILRDLYVSDDPSSSLGKAIRYQYTDWTNPNNSTKIREMLMQLSGDYPFVADVVKATDAHAILSQKQHTYFYHFTARPSYDIMFRGLAKWMKGVSHAEDTIFHFGFSQRFIENFGQFHPPTQEDLDTAEIMVTAWSNFAKTGNPNEPVPLPMHWPTYTASEREHLEITHHLSSASVKKRFGEPWVSFWLELVPSLLHVKDKRQKQQPSNERHTEL